MKTNKIRFPIAAVLFTLYALHYITEFFAVFEFYSGHYTGLFPFKTILFVLIPILIGVLLFLKRRDGLLAIAFVADIVLRLTNHFAYEMFYQNVFLFEFSPILCIVASAFIALLIVVNCEQQFIKVDFTKISVICNKFWFVPGVLSLIAVIDIISWTRALEMIEYMGVLGFMSDANYIFAPLLWQTIYAVALFMLCRWIVDPYVTQKEIFTKNTNDANINNVGEEAYCNLGKHILLCLFTCGIWYLIWIYRTTKFLNKAPNTIQQNPSNKLLLCMFVPFYQIYWLYNQGQRIDAMSKQKKLNNSDMATLCLILGIFIPIVACILMQDRINALCTTKTVATEKETEDDSTTEKLVRYKELLEDGVITQEEFDAKKKQLLGL